MARRALWLAVVFATTCLMASSALAADDAGYIIRARSFEDRALPLSAAREYVRGWTETRVPEYLFYAARTLDRAGESGTAVRYYKKYLVGDPWAVNRREVLARVRHLEAVALHQVPALAEPVAPPAPPSDDPENDDIIVD